LLGVTADPVDRLAPVRGFGDPAGQPAVAELTDPA